MGAESIAAGQVPSLRKNIGLILLSLFFLPLDTVVTVVALFLRVFLEDEVQQRRRIQRDDLDFQPRRILVTGVGMSKGLAIARSFYEAGHDVVGADFEQGTALACGRFSKSLASFHKLRAPDGQSGSAPYVDSLLRVVQQEHVDLWISCSGVASAVEDGEAKEIIESRTPCKAVQFDAATTQVLHEKHSFIERTKAIGLLVPDTLYITDQQTVASALRQAPADRKYIMKPVGMDDANRGDLTLLPRATASETADHLDRLSISTKSSWILQQYIRGPEYCTHSIVIQGQVRAFVACPSAELLMHYEALPASSKLSQAMLDFTKHYAARGGEQFTGHLSFDFMIDEAQMDGPHSVRKGEDLKLYPIECNPRAHTAVVLFNGTRGMPTAYLSLLDKPIEQMPTIEPQHRRRYYWIGHDLVELILLPVLSILLRQPGYAVSQIPGTFVGFLDHILNWYDGTFERWDPLPWWWLYHGYWPARFWQCAQKGTQWSRINVSTTKMFLC